jgi:2-polyprenyl-3-methyl-5-hydroxy-6-metoxy-1,4-benzoquinol methylase
MGQVSAIYPAGRRVPHGPSTRKHGMCPRGPVDAERDPSYAARTVAGDPDAAFREIFSKTAEFTPTDKKYAAYVSFNEKAVERGRSVVKRLGELIELRGCDALDIGAGSGGLSIALADAGARVRAIEPDPNRLQWAKVRIQGHGAEVDLSEASAEALPFAGESFDLVTLDSVVEHVQDPRRVVEEVSRVLRPGGTAYLVTPNKLSAFNVLRDPHYEMFGVVLLPRWLGKPYVERVRRVERGYWVYVIPTKRWLVRRFAKAGARVEQLIPDGFEKLAVPGAEIRGPRAVRVVARIAVRLRMTGLLRRLALAQYPAFVLLARKNGRRQTPEGRPTPAGLS